MDDRYMEIAERILSSYCYEETKKNIAAAIKKAVSELEAENKSLRKELKDLHRTIMCEGQDPNGTIWEHATKVQNENKSLREAILISAIAKSVHKKFPWLPTNAEYRIAETMLQAIKPMMLEECVDICPDCGGNKEVFVGYTQSAGGELTPSEVLEICPKCQGRGVTWKDK